MREESTPRPSPRAVERLEQGLDHELGDLRARLHRALAEADEHQAAGRDDLAAAALEAERATLAEVHSRLQERLAAASVEREAESVVAAVDAGTAAPQRAASAVADEDTAAPLVDAAHDGPAGPTPVVDAPFARVLASAVAAIVGVVLLAGADLGPGGVTAAGTDTGAAEPSDATTTSQPSTSGDRDDAGPAEPVPAQVDGTSAVIEEPAAEVDATHTSGADDADRSVRSPAPRGPLEEPLDLPLPQVDLVDRLGVEEPAERDDAGGGAGPFAEGLGEPTGEDAPDGDGS